MIPVTSYVIYTAGPISIKYYNGFHEVRIQLLIELYLTPSHSDFGVNDIDY